MTKTRRRVTWELRDRHGGKVDPKWANRRRLLTGRERLSDKNFAMMWNAIDEDASAQILSAYIAKEELRTLLSTVRLGGKNPHLTRHRLHRFLAWCIDSNISELIAPVKTVDLRWPEIKAAILTGHSNARSEGYNRLVKHEGRNAFGFRNPINQRRRIRWACTRQHRQVPATTTTELPGQVR